ncbi:A24 family peptidase [Comamonas guangdongensis]|uniref:Prepilin peptidase n=1 Tax=Comamonas guangdongensis TaxID=510515 RepID=A0ABV3ZXW5_9BURK
MSFLFLLWLCISAILDARFRKCFNWLVILGLVLAITSMMLIPEKHPVNITVKDGLFGSLIAFFAFLIFYGLGVMGAGDVKFSAVLGAWVGWELLVPIWVLSCCLVIAHGFVVRSNLKFFFNPDINWSDGSEDGRKKFIPYVTYLSMATVMVLMLDK